MGENKGGGLIQKSFVKNLIFGVFGETEFFETFSQFFFENVNWNFLSKLRIIVCSKSTTIVIFIARRRRKFWQDLGYNNTFCPIKTMILQVFPKQNKGESSKFSAFGHNFSTPRIVFLASAVNVNLHFWTFQSHW